jgi:hypothetical protein
LYLRFSFFSGSLDEEAASSFGLSVAAYASKLILGRVEGRGGRSGFAAGAAASVLASSLGSGSSAKQEKKS